MPYEETIELIINEIKHTLTHMNPGRVEMALEDLTNAKRLFIAGAGRSGMVMRSFAIRLMQVGCPVFVVGETITPAIGSGDLLVIGSGSGRTDSLVFYAKKAKSAGARLLLFTFNPDSPINKLADRMVQIPASPEDRPGKIPGTPSIQMKGTLFEQSLFLVTDYLVFELTKRANLSAEDLLSRHANLE